MNVPVNLSPGTLAGTDDSLNMGRSRKCLWKTAACSLFFPAALAYLYAVGAAGLPSVHYYFDAIGIRDAGTVWDSLTWNMADKKYFLPAAVFGHIEGPLQFLLLNGYYGLVGDALPLSPRTAQFPNTIIAFLCVALLYGMGRKTYGGRFGVFCAASFALAPWLAVTMRFPWIFNTASCCLQLAVLYCYLGFASDPGKAFYRAAAPASLALYLLVGLDWPLFLFVLAVFLVMRKKWREAVKNPYNMMPLAVFLAHMFWTVGIYYYEKNHGSADPDNYKRSMLLYAFLKAGDAGTASFPRMLEYAIDAGGLVIFLGFAGLVLFLRSDWRPAAPDERSGIRRSFMACMAAWFLLGSGPLLRSSSSVTYAYVVAVPAAVLAGRALLPLKNVQVAVIIALMALLQGYEGLYASSNPYRFEAGARDDRRVPAAAAFLLENRPDLLAGDKTAFLPRDAASNLGQYLRGRNKRIVMPAGFPVENALHSFTSTPEAVLRDFVEVYGETGRIKADWLALGSELLADGHPARDFYGNLLRDPDVQWIAVFRDAEARSLWIGEVARAGNQPEDAPVFEPGALAELYEKKYNRLSFLKRNVRYIDHY